MHLLDAGCATGYFSLPMARLTGAEGRVHCVDPQRKMLGVLSRRADAQGLSRIIDARSCTFDSLMLGDLRGQIDVALTFAVLHEVRDRARFVRELHETLKHDALLVFGAAHGFSAEEFSEALNLFLREGFVQEREQSCGRNRIVILRKAGQKARDAE